MKRIILIAALLTFFISPAKASELYILDKEHTTILFLVDHLGFSDMAGQFKDYNGSFKLNEVNPEESSVEIAIKPGGIQTSSTELDKILQGEEWFNTKKFPEMKFVSTNVKMTGDKTADVEGKFTMLGVTKPLIIKVRLNKTGYHPLTNDYVAGFYAEGMIKRSEFGMDHFVSFGVGDDITLQIRAEGINQEKKRPAMKK